MDPMRREVKRTPGRKQLVMCNGEMKIHQIYHEFISLYVSLEQVSLYAGQFEFRRIKQKGAEALLLGCLNIRSIFPLSFGSIVAIVRSKA